MRIVMNSSTTILLAKTNLLRVVDEQFEEVSISQQVFTESVDKPKQIGYDDAIITEREIKEGRIKVKSIRSEAIVKEMMRDFQMGRGEAETVALVLEEEIGLLATDDYQCMKAARALGIPFTQAITLIVSLFEASKITKEKALESIERLKEYGWYADWIIEDARNRVR
jgi:predicted nucleic acid-binding protein